MRCDRRTQDQSSPRTFGSTFSNTSQSQWTPRRFSHCVTLKTSYPRSLSHSIVPCSVSSHSCSSSSAPSASNRERRASRDWKPCRYDRTAIHRCRIPEHSDTPPRMENETSGTRTNRCGTRMAVTFSLPPFWRDARETMLVCGVQREVGQSSTSRECCKAPMAFEYRNALAMVRLPPPPPINASHDLMATTKRAPTLVGDVGEPSLMDRRPVAVRPSARRRSVYRAAFRFLVVRPILPPAQKSDRCGNSTQLTNYWPRHATA